MTSEGQLLLVVETVGLVLVPALTMLALIGWLKRIRPKLPWRNGLALMALLIVSICWIVAVAVDVPRFVFGHYAPWMDSLLWLGMHLSKPLSLIAAVLALALRRAPRIEVLAASLLMFAFWPGGYS